MIGGTLRSGERLPPIRDLVRAVGLSPNTVASAYRRLADRGVVIGRGRRGTFVAERPGPVPEPPVSPGLVDLASGNPDPALLPDLAQYPVDTGTVLYGERSVDPALEAAMRRVLVPDGLPDAEMAVVSGALDGVERALSAHLRVGNAVAVEAPGWPAFSDLLTSMGMRVVPVPIDDRGMLPERLAAVAGRVEAVMITPRFQNPTGAATDTARASELRRVLEPYDHLLVVEDDHGGLISGVPLASVAPGRPRWVHVHSVSKSLGPDLRVAALVGDALTIGRVMGRQAAGPGWVSHLLQRLVARLLDDPDMPALLTRAATAYRERRTAMLEALEARGVSATGRTGLNVWAWVPDEDAVLTALTAAGYAVRAGERWRMGTPPAIRISVGRLEPTLAPEVAAVVAAASSRSVGRRSA